MGSEVTQKSAGACHEPTVRAGARAIQVGALLLLVFQNSAEALVMRQSAIASAVQPVTQIGVILQELVKFLLSILCIIVSGDSLREVVISPWELFCAGIPALLYLVQNNLQYVALQHLDAATFAVTYQLKILSTALLSVWLLGKHLSSKQWWSLRLLVAGVGIVQVVNGGDSEGSVNFGALANPWAHASSDTVKGLAAVLVATVLSGIAGVYTEKMLKHSSVCLWVRNTQISGCSIIIGIFVLGGSTDVERVRTEGFFVGYTGWTLAAIMMKSFGGLLVAIVIKYTDNIAKNFSTAASMIITTVISSAFLGLQMRPGFLIGISVVCYSTVLYNGVDPLAMFQRVVSFSSMPSLAKSAESKKGC